MKKHRGPLLKFYYTRLFTNNKFRYFPFNTFAKCKRKKFRMDTLKDYINRYLNFFILKGI